MQKYFIRRLLLAIPTIFGAVTLVFFAMHLAPGDPIALFVPSDRSGAVKQEVIDEMRHRYGFDKPLPDQYVAYLKTWPISISGARCDRTRSSPMT